MFLVLEEKNQQKKQTKIHSEIFWGIIMMSTMTKSLNLQLPACLQAQKTTDLDQEL